MLKYILANKKLDLLKIKKNLNSHEVLGVETTEILLELGLFDSEYIKDCFVPDIFADAIYQTDMLALIIREIKKAKFEISIDINKLFKFVCAVSKKQARLVYDNYNHLINLDKNQRIWLGYKN